MTAQQSVFDKEEVCWGLVGRNKALKPWGASGSPTYIERTSLHLFWPADPHILSSEVVINNIVIQIKARQ